MFWPFNKLTAVWPDKGRQAIGIEPRSSYADPIGELARPGYETERIHGKSDGYLPKWKFVQPPGVGDAPQWVWDTFSLIPFDLNGPYDAPMAFLKTLQPFGLAPFAMRWQGMAIETGEPLMYGLTEPNPATSPGNDIYGEY